MDRAYEIPFETEGIGYGESLRLLKGALRFGIQPMLESVADMLDELGRPDGRFRVVQIAGTNGKTSTARYVAAILAGEGLSTALYTSPELVSYTERMEVGGTPVPEPSFARGIAAAAEAGRRVNARRAAAGERPYDITEFDLLTVGAMVVFAEAGVDVAVLECGMGGRWDATSATRPEAVAVTGIGLDHMRILGDTLEEIAGEKAAIIRAGRRCVLGVGTATPWSVEEVFLDRCAREGVEPVLLRPERPSDAAGEMRPGPLRPHAGLPHAGYLVTSPPRALGDRLVCDVVTPRGRHGGVSARKPLYQAANIACAIALSEEFLGRALDDAALRASVAACPTPGRFDVLRSDPLVLVDACHNPQSVEAFLAALGGVEPEVPRRPQLLCAVLADKDVAGIVRLLAHEFPRVSVTRTSSPRAIPADDLAALFRAEGVEPAATYPDVPAAVEALRGEPFVACGSITTAGEVAGLLGR
jgi:dihydrofolate synthase/folylpolyglutamate synthase